MWVRSHKKTYTGVKKENIWRVWTDVNQWSDWHGDLDTCTMEGPFAVGNYFMLKPKGMKAVRIDLVDVIEGKQFTDCTKFFGARMYDTHALEETENGLCLSNKLEVVGPLKWLWIKLVANNVAATIPDEMDALVAKARSLA